MKNHLMIVIVLYIFSQHKLVFAAFKTKLSPQPLWNSTHTDKLRKDLLFNYDKFARPAQHYNVTTVHFGFTITHIEVNEFQSSLTVHSRIHLTWNDEKMKWDPSYYGGISAVNLASHEIWQPDIVLHNSATNNAISQYGNVHCIVYEDGKVLWVPPAQFNVLCNFNLKYWPFDSQSCKLIFGSWTYYGDQIDMELLNNETQATLQVLAQNTEWAITKTNLAKITQYHPCCSSPYPYVTLEIFFNRISPSYKTIIVTPAFVIILLILANFWLPPLAGEKIALNACTSIIICLLLLYFTQKLPSMGTHTPLIVSFYCSCLYLVSFSLIISVVVIWLSRTKHSTPLPWIIKHHLIGTFGQILGLKTYIQQSSRTSLRVTAEEMSDHQVTDFEENSTGNESHIDRSCNKMRIQHDWILLAACIDRIAFCFLCFLLIILSIVYSV